MLTQESDSRRKRSVVLNTSIRSNGERLEGVLWILATFSRSLILMSQVDWLWGADLNGLRRGFVKKFLWCIRKGVWVFCFVKELGEPGVVVLVQGQPGLLSEFKPSLNYKDLGSKNFFWFKKIYKIWNLRNQILLTTQESCEIVTPVLSQHTAFCPHGQPQGLTQGTRAGQLCQGYQKP